MKISLLVRNFNYGRFLRRCLESALAQDHPGDLTEIVVVDDGSTDESPEILRAYEGRVRAIQGPRRGAIAALNAAIRASTGEAFTLLDADDWAEPQLVSALAAPLQADPACAFSYCDYWEESADGSNRRRISVAADPFQGIAAGFLYRRAVAERFGLYDETVMFAEYDLLAKALRAHRGSHVPRPLYHYIRHGENMTADDERVRRELERLRERYGPSFRIREYRYNPQRPLVLRPAEPTEEDARLLLSWRNDPVARGASFTTGEIPWEAHREWYLGRLRVPSTRLLFGVEGLDPVGAVRLDEISPGLWEIGIHLAPDRRFGGRGPRLLLLAEKALRAFKPQAKLRARIRQDNPASQAAFRKAGYVERERTMIHGVPAQIWEKT